MTKQEYYEILIKDANNKANSLFIENVLDTGEYNDDSDCTIKYRFEHLPLYDQLKSMFPITDIAGNGSSFQKAINIMDWLTSVTYYCGYSDIGPSLPLKIIDYSFNKSFDNAINCANKAIILADFLMSAGIFALPVWIENHIYQMKHLINQDCGGNGICHCVTHVYLPELNKWIVLDPSFNSYFTDSKGNILNLIEMASIYKKDEQINIAQYSLNGSESDFKDYYLESFIYTSLFSMRIWTGNNLSDRNFNNNYFLLPKNCDLTMWCENDECETNLKTRLMKTSHFLNAPYLFE